MRAQEKLVLSRCVLKQVHGVHIVKADPTKIFEADGMATDRSDLFLVIRHADCQAATFFDPKKKVLGALHSGWRGLSLNSYAHMVNYLRVHYGVLPIDLQVNISPSIGPCCSEMIHYQKELPPHLWTYQVKPFYFDFWQIAIDQLKDQGVSAVFIDKRCTCCHPQHFPSYRRDKTSERMEWVARF